VNAGIDLVWIGARTVANPFSVQALADALREVPHMPVLVKNPINLDLELWTGALERLQQAGITRLGAIHRGFHALNPNEYRNVPHWDLVIQFRTRFPEVPLLCDPSHISGSPNLLPQVAQKALDLDAVGLMIETHINPLNAWSDAAQQVTPEHLKRILEALHISKPNSENPVFRDKLEALRKEIDGLDAELLNVLARRMSISRKIGAYKEAHHITIFQLERWMQVLRDQKQWGMLAGFSEEFIQRFYEAVHQESIRVQTEAQNRKISPEEGKG
jgi:chorismate mutase